MHYLSFEENENNIFLELTSISASKIKYECAMDFGVGTHSLKWKIR